MRSRHIVLALTACTFGLLLPGAGGAHRLAGPVNTSPPTITLSGFTATANPGTWNGTGAIAYTYEWQVCNALGAACMPFFQPPPGEGPYTTQTVKDARSPQNSTVRVVVTATDDTGSASAASKAVDINGANAGGGGGGGGSGAGGKHLTITLLSPRRGTIVHTQRFSVVVKVVGGSGAKLRVSLAGQVNREVVRTGPPGRFTFPVAVARSRTTRITVAATGGGASGRANFAVPVEPPVTAIQQFGGGSALIAPGCTTCVIHDPRGDDKGSPPDIATATSKYRNGWVTITIVTYDTVTAAHGGHPCIQAWTIPYGGRSHSFGLGCFEGPHLGMVYGDGSCPHSDANDDCGTAHESFPNTRTTRYRFRPAQIGSPPAFDWQAWVLYPGDQLKDTVPANVQLGNTGLNCWVKQQLRVQPPEAYSFARNPCR